MVLDLVSGFGGFFFKSEFWIRLWRVVGLALGG